MDNAERHDLKVPAKGRWLTALTLAFATFTVGSTACAQDDGAGKILKAMSDYVTSQKSFTATFDTSIEVNTPEVEKIQIHEFRSGDAEPPDKLRASRTGDYADVELVFDGKMISVLGKDANSYAQTDAAGSVDQLTDDAYGRIYWRC